MKTRKPDEHLNNDEVDYYYPIQKRITACWNAATPEFNKVWEKLYIRWFGDNYMEEEEIEKPLDLFCWILYNACAVLSYDVEDITPTHWLPCVVTLRDLIDMLDMIYYGLSDEELNVKIFEHSAEEDNEDCEEDDEVIMISIKDGVATYTDISKDDLKD